MTSIGPLQVPVKPLACAVAALAIAIMMTGCNEVHGEAPVVARPVKAIEARPAEGSSAVRYSVSIAPHEQIPLAFKASGYVDDVLQRRGADGQMRALQAGDSIRAGAILARVREADYRERLNQATGSLREIEAAQTKAARDLERARTLFAAEALTKPDLDTAEAAHDANLARIASANAQIEATRLALRDTALVAPRTGVVLDRKIEVGSLVAGGTVGFVIADVSTVKAIFGVPDSLVHHLTLGQPIAVTAEAFRGDTFTGRVTGISPSADPQSRVFDVEITIPNADGRLRPGMIGAVELSPDAATAPRTSPAVPLSSIVRADQSGDTYAVFVIDSHDQATVVRLRRVTLGPIQGNLVGVTAGLEPGERVVVMGAALLKDGDTVQVIP